VLKFYLENNYALSSSFSLKGVDNYRSVIFDVVQCLSLMLFS